MGERATIDQDYLYDIADAIREKKGVTTRFMPAEMKPAILSIPTGSDVDVDPLNVTQNGTYTAPTGKGYSPVTVNVQGGGQGGVEHLTPPLLGAEIINTNGVSITTNEPKSDGVEIQGQEYSAGYEGMNVIMRDLTVGQEYEVAFEFQSTDAAFFGGQYTIGYKVSATAVTSYPASSTPDSSYTAFTRDLTVNSCSTRFTATASTMYIVFAFVGYSDYRTNDFTISKLKVTEASI